MSHGTTYVELALREADCIELLCKLLHNLVTLRLQAVKTYLRRLDDRLRARRSKAQGMWPAEVPTVGGSADELAGHDRLKECMGVAVAQVAVPLQSMHGSH